ncbi:MAG: serine/threonine-protein phosphatase [Treponema sp.]|jgi:sigma-B regulation protein RsbU (phosphoserine phosphatase)|nr:serine/threonine-protein phosphatase [Treponema sp.]
MMKQRTQELGRIFSPFQIGYITTYIEPLDVSSNVEWALEFIADWPETEVIPVERNGAVLGVVSKQELEKLAGSAWTRFWQKDLDAYLIQAKEVIDATTHISKLTEEAVVKYKNDSSVWYIVQHRRSYLGIVSLRQMMEYINIIHSQDLARAVEIQNHLLKKSQIKDKRFNVVFFNTMAHEVGGDFFRIYQASPDRYVVCCFDVAGKNISGAMTTMALGACFSAFELFQYSGSADKMTSRVNDLLRSVNPPGIFVTAVLFYIDFGSRTIRVHNCGYSPVLIFVRNDNKISYKTSAPNMPPLGVIDNLDFSDNQIVPITKNLRICAYSDGITDMADIYGERYGEERTTELVKQMHTLPQTEVAATMKKTIEQWIGAASLADDITLVDIRFF